LPVFVELGQVLIRAQCRRMQRLIIDRDPGPTPERLTSRRPEPPQLAGAGMLGAPWR
jgi:hypothetical protein